MLQKTLDHLRERPHEDKRAVAAAVSLVVVALIAIIWSYFFFHSALTPDAPDLPAQTASAVVSQQ